METGRKKKAGVCKAQVERSLGTGAALGWLGQQVRLHPRLLGLPQLNDPLFLNPAKNALPSSCPGRGRGALGSSRSQGAHLSVNFRHQTRNSVTAQHPITLPPPTSP